MAYFEGTGYMVLFSVNRVRSFLLLLLVSTALILAGYIYNNIDKLPQSISVDITMDGVNIGIKKFHLMEEEDGKKKWELEADEAWVIDSRNVTMLKDVQMTFFQREKEDTKLRADEGVVKDKIKKIEVQGNVVISNDHYVLKSHQLTCQWDSSLVTTREFVEITGRNFKVTGIGMVSNLKEKKIEISRDVKMMIYPEGDG